MTKATPYASMTGSSTSELRILPDGRILVHNLTPTVAALLAELDPDDTSMRHRADSSRATTREENQPEPQS